MSATNFTPIQIYYSTTAAAVPVNTNLLNGELAINITDGKLYYKNNSGTVTLLASSAGASGDVVGPSSATDNALARFDLTTGKLIQNSVGILSDAGALTGLTGLTSTSITDSGLTSGRVTYAGTGGLLQDSANLTFDGTNLGVGVTLSTQNIGSTLELKGGASLSGGAFPSMYLTSNAVYNAGWTYKQNGYASFYLQQSGQHQWQTATSGTAGAVPTFTQAMTLDASGNLNVGTTSTPAGSSSLSRFITAAGTNDGVLQVTRTSATAGGGAIASAAGPGMLFYTHTGTVASETYTERMRIDASGRLLIGTTTASGANYLQVNSDSLINGLTVGRGAGAVATNTAVGASALATNTSGVSNTATGYQALNAVSTGNNNSAYGRNSLLLNTGSNNTGYGAYTLQANTSGAQNAAFGQSAGYGNTTGVENSFFGTSAGYTNSTGAYNTAIGSNSLYSNTTASSNTAVGYQAGYSNTTGGVTAVGRLALYSNTTGTSNVAIGNSAAYGMTTGGYNIAIGESALYNNATGSQNVAI